MKLSNLPDILQGFTHKEVEFCGIPALLITPEISAKWAPDNLIYRSLIVSKYTLEVLSSGFPKFFNAGEKPGVYPDPEKFNDWKVYEKIDGSLLIADWVNNTFSMRTRGTTSYKQLDNHSDFEELTQQYPNVLTIVKSNPHLSFLFEIMTPNRVIVVQTATITFTFLGAVDKRTCTLVTTQEYHKLAQQLGVNTPEEHPLTTLEELVENVKIWKNKEGVVLTYNNNQNRVKLKSNDYLCKHRAKSTINSDANLIDLYIQLNTPEYPVFFNVIETLVDYETATALESKINRLVEARNNTLKEIQKLQSFVDRIKRLPTRKAQAMEIQQQYGSANVRKPIVFNLIDGKSVNEKQYLQLFTAYFNAAK